MRGRSCVLMAQCDKCLDHFELTGYRVNGTLSIDFNSRVKMVRQALVDKCGGEVRLFSQEPADIGPVEVIYPGREEKIGARSGKPKSRIFEAKT